MECIFCSIIKGEKEAIYVYKDEHFIAIMDKYPINIGHTLVIPRTHYRTLLDMPINEVGMLFVLATHLAKAITHALKSDGFSIGQNNGEAANQIIPHVHVHIVPRFVNDMARASSRRFVTTEQLKETANIIKRFVEPVNYSFL